MARAHPLFVKGLELFNKKEYFECHEVIEELWLKTPSEDPYRDLYKGVIQAAAAVYQFDRGVLSGANGLFKTAAAYLEKYRPAALGLNVDKLLLELNVCFAVFKEWDGRSEIARRQMEPVLEFER